MILKQIKDATAYILSRINVKPQFGIVLGSGLGTFADELSDKVTIAFKEIPYFPVSTVEGHPGKMVIGTFEKIPILILQGRFHYYEGYDMDQVTFPIRCIQSLGIPNLIVTNAAGSVDTDYKPGDLMLIKDHIKLQGENPLRGANLDEYGPRFNDMSNPYTAKIRKMATGVLDHHVDHAEVIRMGARVKEKFITLLKSILREWATL